MIQLRTRDFGMAFAALTALTAAVLLLGALDVWLGNPRPLVTLYAAIGLAVWVGGYRPAAVVAVVGYAACDWLFIDAAARTGENAPIYLAGLAAYALAAVLIIGFGEALRRTRRVAEQARDRLKNEADAVARQRAEAALAESEATLRAFYDASPVCMGVVEPLDDGDILHVYDNPATCRFFGLQPGSTLNRRALKDLAADPQVVARWRDAYEWSGRTAQPVHFEHPYGKDATRWLGVTVCAIAPGPSGRPRYCYVAEDITDRKRADAMMQRQAAIFEHQTDAIIVTDLDGRIVDWNPACERMLGYAKAEVLGRPIAMLHRPQDSEWITQTGLAAIRRDGEWRAEIHFVRKDGSVGECETIVKPLIDDNGEITGSVGVNRDITERRRADEALRDSEQRLRLALEAGRMGTWEWNIGTGQVRWDDNLQRMHGYVPGTFPGTFEAYEREIHPADREYVQRTIQQSFEHGEHHLEYRIVWRDGSVHWVEGRGKLFRDGDGNPLRLVGVCIDATERKRAEEALLEADRRKDEFLATLAHELRNPLAPVLNAAHVLKLYAADDERLAWSRDVIERQVTHMARLLDDLLDVSRITRDRLELRRTRVALATVIDIAVETSRPMIDAAGHTLQVDLPPEPVFLEADPVRLAQVFSNLLNNAAKYTERGGRIELRAERHDDEVAVAVKDNGIGIARETLPRLFRMFAQAEAALERSHGGLGIGLALSKALVELHDGHIDVASDGPGKGSTFTVRLPALAQAAATRDEAPRDDGPDGEPHPWRILIVDDMKDSADSLGLLLGAAGHEVHVAYDGEAAVDAVETFRPDVVLLDLGMPTLNGYDTCRRIRAQAWGRDTRLVALTGWGQQEDRRRTEEAGFDAHLVKPVDPRELTAVLSALRRSQARTPLALA